ncbi:MAG: hypothetical protein O3A63_15725 [Proteobacteria bacterium]|nr:hypothetical protein [Pseudomonadota bacterium]
MALDSFKLDGPDGPLDAQIVHPPQASAMLVLAHGAGAAFNHTTMIAISEAMAAQGIATLRFNFPYMQKAR